MKYRTVGDLINNPEHYNQGDIECIDAIKAMLDHDEFVGTYEVTRLNIVGDLNIRMVLKIYKKLSGMKKNYCKY